MKFLDELRAANLQRVPDFKAGDLYDWSPAERGNELAGETGEACNELKKLLRHEKQRQRMWRNDPSGAAVTASIAAIDRDAIIKRARNELADVVICVDLICAQLGFDIEEVVRAKFNATSDKIGSQVKL